MRQPISVISRSRIPNDWKCWAGIASGSMRTSARGIPYDSARSTIAASFSPRAKVNVAEHISVGVDTARIHFFDLDTGLAIR